MFVRRSLSLASLVLCLCACQPSVPGERVGTYNVTLKLVQNTCGPNAVYVEDGAHYAAELRADSKGHGYWRVPGQPALEGSYDAGKFTFMIAQNAAASTSDAGNACVIVQATTLAGDVSAMPLDAGAPDAAADRANDAGASDTSSLTATYTLSLAPDPSTDCNEALAPMGPYAALPCTVQYTLTGTERDAL